MSKNTEKKTENIILSYDYILKNAYSTIRVSLICTVIIELIFGILGLVQGKKLQLFLLVGLGLSSIVIFLMCKEIIKVICVKCGYISIKDDEITKTWIRTRGSEDYFYAYLEKNGKISLSELEYKGIKQGDKMYVVKYGTRLLKDVYSQSFTKIDQDLMVFYEK